MFQRLRSRPASFYKRLWALTLPIALQNLITFSLGLIDTFMVSQLGNTEMAAVTAANGPVFLLMSMVFGIQSGLSILASQYWGKRTRRTSAAHWAWPAFWARDCPCSSLWPLLCGRCPLWIFSVTVMRSACWAPPICGLSASPMYAT
ncbi:MAG: hypothetical protein II458_04730 [Oscillospiraceae bacterium]|nr:hypothetical protein [Oscillospiraceae bacterium]